MGMSKIIIICLYFFLLWLAMVANKEIERSRAKWAERKAKFLEHYYNDKMEERERDFRELQVKYDNIERELLRRDKQYKELLERVNKNG